MRDETEEIFEDLRVFVDKAFAGEKKWAMGKWRARGFWRFDLRRAKSAKNCCHGRPE
jgi:hypothetical protein